ncbi:Phosphate transport system permease protein 1 [Moorella glycerini]|uniref:Phosphate import ATP-binding protein PstB 3 n=1 Tax=Neomoorella stamsii TaxID=1266720 RepID=A0A9X7P753_9FIRM|nr:MULTISPECIES: phosphate ABC transporter ATP-binding protein PstB [Moorella]PRR76257.1 Phosphate import ATP-binding protein PstB 3 [Moorella stamsii]CEP66567.1 Phosphate transport system permease protein 1 [Moorella glycerini]
MDTRLLVEDFSAWYGQTQAVKSVTLPVYASQVTAIIGPSGCGKSTFIRCLNRLHELIPGTRTRGRVLLDGQNIYDDKVDPAEIRRRVGMVFQKPNPFPTMSIFDNVAAGLRVHGLPPGTTAEEVVEKSLKMVGLWDEVADRLQHSGVSLSGGQQQRLCIARALAVEPEVLLMDEPCSALDPVSTLKIEELIKGLKEKYTIVIVTHNMHQAARVADYTAFFLNGQLIEYGVTSDIFTNPRDQRTEDYITGRFG